MVSAHPRNIGEDDYLAPVPDTPFWNEAMATMVADGATGISASLYISRWWGKPVIMRHMIAFLLPGNRAVFARNYGTPPDTRTPHVAGFEITPLGDGRIRYTYDGPMDLRRQSDVASYGLGSGPTVRVTFDLIFSSRLPVWDLQATHPSGHKTDPLFPGGHAEQLGQLDGIVTIDGATFELKRASTCRDHSRGVRDWSAHHSHMWLNTEFESGWGFCSFQSSVVGRPGIALNAAVLFKDGKTIPATMHTEGQLKPGDDIWRPFEIVLKPVGIDPIAIQVGDLWNCWPFGIYDPGDLYWGVPAGVPDPRAFWTTEQSGVFRVRGEIGYGRVERCNRDIIVDDLWRRSVSPDKFAR